MNVGATCSYTEVTGNTLGNAASANSRYGVNCTDAASSAYLIRQNKYFSLATAETLIATAGSYTQYDNTLGQKEYWANGIPATGSFTRGDKVWNTNPTNAAGQPVGWVRVSTGSGNVLNTDWRVFGATV